MTYREQMVILLQKTGFKDLEVREQIADFIANSNIKPKDSTVLHAPENAKWDDEKAKIGTEI